MQWPEIETRVREIVRDCAGLKDSNVFWAGREQVSSWHMDAPDGAGGGTGSATCELSIDGLVGTGQDERIASFDANTSLRTITLVGNRRFVLSLKFESESARLGQSARAAAAQFLLMIPEHAYSLEEVGVQVADPGPVIEAGYDADGRKISVAVIDVAMNARDIVVLAPSSSGWIESVTVELTTSDPDSVRTFTVPDP